VAAVFQFVAVFWAYRLGSRQAAKAQQEQQEYNEKLAREGALRTILMSEVPRLNDFLTRFHSWIECNWRMGSNYSGWGDVWDELKALCEFVRSITKDAILLSELEAGLSDYTKYCQKTLADHQSHGSRDPETRNAVLALRDRFCEMRDTNPPMQRRVIFRAWLRLHSI
jgi:hypothetical protein